jgi:hemerythrin-like domain-containing protein
MKCGDLVMKDHVVLRRALDILDAMLTKMESGERIEIADVTSILHFLRIFGNEYHQSMEEKVLFPALRAAAPYEASLEHFIVEHGDERKLIVEIEDALKRRRGIDFVRNSRQLVALFRNHCDREDMILCELTAKHFSSQQNDEIVAEFTRKRVQVEIHSNLSRLEQKYISRPLYSVQTAGAAYSRR